MGDLGVIFAIFLLLVGMILCFYGLYAFLS